MKISLRLFHLLSLTFLVADLFGFSIVAQAASENHCQDLFRHDLKSGIRIPDQVITEIGKLWIDVLTAERQSEFRRLYEKKLQEIADLYHVKRHSIEDRVRLDVQRLIVEEKQKVPAKPAPLPPPPVIRKLPRFSELLDTQIPITSPFMTPFSETRVYHSYTRKYALWTNDSRYALLWDKDTPVVFDTDQGGKVVLPRGNGLLSTNEAAFLSFPNENHVQVVDLETNKTTLDVDGYSLRIRDLISKDFAIIRRDPMAKGPIYFHHVNLPKPITLSDRFAYSAKSNRLAYFSFWGLRVLDTKTGSQIPLPWSLKLLRGSTPKGFIDIVNGQDTFLPVFRGNRRYDFCVDDLTLYPVHPELNLVQVRYGSTLIKYNKYQPGILELFDVRKQKSLKSGWGKMVSHSKDLRWHLFAEVDAQTSAEVHRLFDAKNLTSQIVANEMNRFSEDSHWLMNDDHAGILRKNRPLHTLNLDTGETVEIQTPGWSFPLAGEYWLTQMDDGFGTYYPIQHSTQSPGAFGEQFLPENNGQFAVSPDRKKTIAGRERNYFILKLPPPTHTKGN